MNFILYFLIYYLVKFIFIIFKAGSVELSITFFTGSVIPMFLIYLVIIILKKIEEKLSLEKEPGKNSNIYFFDIVLIIIGFIVLASVFLNGLLIDMTSTNILMIIAILIDFLNMVLIFYRRKINDERVRKLLTYINCLILGVTVLLSAGHFVKVKPNIGSEEYIALSSFLLTIILLLENIQEDTQNKSTKVVIEYLIRVMRLVALVGVVILLWDIVW